MLKVLVDLLWWMGLIFGDLYDGGCKTMVVGWVSENCNWWVCGSLEVVEAENGRKRFQCFRLREKGEEKKNERDEGERHVTVLICTVHRFHHFVKILS